MKYRTLLVMIWMTGVYTLEAQGEAAPDFMRSTGKIYVVAAVCLVILLVLLGYLVRLDRKISKIEKRQNHE